MSLSVQKTSLVPGISYIAHPQANPTRVTDFKNIERITTCTLQPNTIEQNRNDKDLNTTDIEIETSEDRIINSCYCNDIKTLLKIKVIGNLDDLTITCNGARTADSIADLVDGYCRMMNNTETSYWDNASNKTLETLSTHFNAQDILLKHLDQSQQALTIPQLPKEGVKNENGKIQFSLYF